jgi:hypothetical protein
VGSWGRGDLRAKGSQSQWVPSLVHDSLVNNSSYFIASTSKFKVTSTVQIQKSFLLIAMGEGCGSLNSRLSSSSISYSRRSAGLRRGDERSVYDCEFNSAF